jgi:hypothetical protein
MPKIIRSVIHKRGSEGVAQAGTEQSSFSMWRWNSGYAVRGVGHERRRKERLILDKADHGSAPLVRRPAWAEVRRRRRG